MKEYTFVPQKTSVYQPVFRSTSYQEFKTELVVPDSQPDVLRFLRSDGCVYLNRKDSTDGAVTVGGTAEVTVSYLPDGTTGIRKLEAAVPFSAELKDGNITEESQLQARVFLIGMETKMLNPRKIQLRLTIGVSVCCWEAWNLRIPQEPEEEEPELELLRESVSRLLPVEVAEKTFMLSEEFTVPALREDGAEMIGSVGEILSCTDTKVGDQLLIKGEAELELLFRTAEGKPEKTVIRYPFSQSMSFEGMVETDRYDVSVSLTGAYLTPDNSEPGKLEWELHAVIQCTQYRETLLSYNADGFCLNGTLHPRWITWNLPGYEGKERVEGNCRDLIRTPSQPSSVLSASVLFGAASLGKDEAGQKLSASGEVTVVYEGDDGRILSSKQRIGVSAPCAFPEGEQLQIELQRTGEIRQTAAEGGVEVQIPFAFSVRRYSSFALTAIGEASLEEETASDEKRPSLVIRRWHPGESLWELAKRYRSSVSLICEANGLGNDQMPQPETWTVIPIKRG